MAAKAKAQEIIDNNAVAVFSKSYCPYCKATKSLLSEAGAKPYIIELDQVGMLTQYLSRREETVLTRGQTMVPPSRMPSRR